MSEGLFDVLFITSKPSTLGTSFSNHQVVLQMVHPDKHNLMYSNHYCYQSFQSEENYVKQLQLCGCDNIFNISYNLKTWLYKAIYLYNIYWS